MGLPYYPRYPRDLLEGTVGMRFELKGAYGLLLDLIYMKDGQLPDDDRYISGHLGLSVRKWNQIKNELLSLDKIQIISGFIRNYRADNLCEATRKYQDKQKINRAKGNKNNNLTKTVVEPTSRPKADQSESESKPYINNSDYITDSVAGARHDPPQENNQSEFQEINQEILETDFSPNDFSQENQIWQPSHDDFRHAKNLKLTDREISHATERARNNNFTSDKSKLFREYCFGAIDARKPSIGKASRTANGGGGTAFGANTRRNGQEVESLSATALRIIGKTQKRGFGGRV